MKIDNPIIFPSDHIEQKMAEEFVSIIKNSSSTAKFKFNRRLEVDLDDYDTIIKLKINPGEMILLDVNGEDSADVMDKLRPILNEIGIKLAN